MLVLSRKRGEKIMIGKDIVLTVLDMEHNKVRIGIQAPAKTAVHREEVHDAIKRREQDGQQ